MSSRLARRRLPARFNTSGTLLPAMSALTMERADWPCKSDTTTPKRMPASVSSLCSRFFSLASMLPSFCRWRAMWRRLRRSALAMKEVRSSPARASEASHCAYLRLVHVQTNDTFVDGNNLHRLSSSLSS